MHIGLSPALVDLQRELRVYYATLLDPATVEELTHSGGIGEAPRRVWKQMCADGWAGIGWPTEYGGQGKGPMEQFIFFDESMRAGAPVPMLTINTVGPSIMQFGTAEQRASFLPRILAGDLHFCIGYSEPEAGTDLASLRCRAERDGDVYVVNGQKQWTSLANDADYCWLAVRTDPDAKKHRGISILAVPLDTPGITITPLSLLSQHDINSVFYDDVRVPVANRMGDENAGWQLITNQLNHERVTLCSSGILDRVLNEVRGWAQTTRRPDGTRVIDQEWVQLNLARVHAKIDFLRLMNWKLAWTAETGGFDVADCSTVKVFGTELNLEALRLLLEVLGPAGYLVDRTPGSVLHGHLERLYRSLVILTFGGGTNEVQRDLIAMFGLGFPRAK
jgi:alkylation response protein AidB-like acyl-CoA dehydrogenase